jgi:hypothetical protein
LEILSNLEFTISYAPFCPAITSNVWLSGSRGWWLYTRQWNQPDFYMQILFKSGLAISGTVLALVITELGSRLLLPPPSNFEVTDLSRITAVGTDTHSLVDEGLPYSMTIQGPHGVRLRPGIHGVIRNHVLSHTDVNLRINSYGMRYPEIGIRDSGEFRTIVLGDSITLADYLPEADTIPALLEADFGPSRRFLNAAVATTGTSEQLYRYLEVADQIDAQLVLVGMFLDDARAAQSVKSLVLREPWASSRLISFIAPRVSFLKSRLFDSGLEQDENQLKQFRYQSAWQDDAWQTISANASLLKKAAESRSAKLAFFLYPLRDQVNGRLDDVPQQHFAKLCTRLNVPCLDLLPALKANARGNSKQLYYDFCHMTLDGHKIVVPELSKWLREKHLVPS